jgi:hypothetical protein
LAALVRRSEPEARHLAPESGRYRQIPRYRVALVVIAQRAPQPFSRLRDQRLHPPAQFLLQFQQFLPPSFAVRDAPDFESAQPVLPANVLESQEGERLRSRGALSSPTARRFIPAIALTGVRSPIFRFAIHVEHGLGNLGIRPTL